MPADFDKCQAEDGRIRTVKGPAKEHGLKEGEYVHYCYDKAGKSHRGDVRKTKKASEFKLRTLVPVIELGKKFAEKVTSEIEVMAEGNWEHPAYGNMAISEEDLDGFVKSFDNKVRKIDIAVDQEHMPEKGAAGWFRELKKVVENGKNKLKAIIEWTPVGQELIGDGIFKYFSPEFDFEHEDWETHELFDNVLLGGALTNRPYFKSLAPVQLSENIFAGFELSEGGENKMTKEELKAKLAESPEFVLGDDATDEDKVSYDEAKKEIEEEAKDADKGEEGDDGDGGDGGDGADDDADKGGNDEGEVQAKEAIKAVEKRHAKEMNELRSQMGVVEKKLRFKEVGEEVRGYTFSESNPDGVILPKSKDAARDLIMSLNTKQAKLFSEFLTTLPKISPLMFGEIGAGDDTSRKSSEELTQKATELQKEEKGLTFGEAVKRVAKANPELAKQAQEEA